MILFCGTLLLSVQKKAVWDLDVNHVSGTDNFLDWLMGSMFVDSFFLLLEKP